MKGVIRLGDATSYGGKVTDASASAFVNDIAVISLYGYSDVTGEIALQT
jgi:uncharacterized Zn-binding protein involved in type VI secretion